MKNIKEAQQVENPRQRYFAIVGNEGFAVVDSEANYVEATRKLHGILVTEFSDFGYAQWFAAYQFAMRASAAVYRLGGVLPAIPMDLQLNQIHLENSMMEIVPALQLNPYEARFLIGGGKNV